MAKSVAEVNEERRTKYNTHTNTFEMFPVGTKVQIICVAQDFHFFKGTETGTVKENKGKYLGIIVKFDKPRQFTGGFVQEEFNFEPKDLIVIKEKKMGRPKKTTTKTVNVKLTKQKPAPTFDSAARERVEANLAMLISKQHDYGKGNILNTPEGIDPLVGLLLRINDKVQRASNLITSGQDPQHESLRDCFADLSNYGTIGLMVIDGVFELPLEKSQK